MIAWKNLNKMWINNFYILLCLGMHHACSLETISNHNDYLSDGITKTNDLAHDEKKNLSEDKNIYISLTQEHIKTKASFDLSIECHNPQNINDNYHATISHSKDIVAIPPQYHCYITINSYDDGKRKFTPLHEALVIEIDHHGSGKKTLPKAYESTPLLMWLEFIPTQPWDLSLASSLYLSSGSKTHHKSSNKTIITKAINLSMNNIPAPNIDNITLFDEENINNYNINNNYTLIASESEVSTCKYIDNSSNNYDPTSWASVDQAFNAHEAHECPSFNPADPSFTSGNFNQLWLPQQKTLIIWANSVNGLNSYTTANIGP